MTQSKSVYARRAAERDARIAEERERAEYEAWRQARQSPRRIGKGGPVLIEATSKTIKVWLLMSWIVLFGSWALAMIMPPGTKGATLGVGMVAFVVIQVIARLARWWRHS